MPLDVWRVAPVVTTCTFVRVARMFGWWWRLWRAMMSVTRCWQHFAGSRTGKNCSWSRWQGYAALVSCTHHPCRTRRMSSLDSVTLMLKNSMIVLGWLSCVAPNRRAFCVWGNESASVWWWGCVRCGGLCAGESSAFCCGFVVCWRSQSSAGEFKTCFVVTGETCPPLNRASFAPSLLIVVKLFVSVGENWSEHRCELNLYLRRKVLKWKKRQERKTMRKNKRTKHNKIARKERNQSA